MSVGPWGTKSARMALPVVSREIPSFRALPRPVRALTHSRRSTEQDWIDQKQQQYTATLETRYLSRGQ